MRRVRHGSDPDTIQHDQKDTFKWPLQRIHRGARAISPG